MKYDKRGVSASKSEVHAAIQGLSKGLFPTAFCKILPDITGGEEAYCNLMHADTAGTKTILAYLYWKESGDMQVWKKIVQDALVMNLDDMACVGVTQDIVISSTIGRNKHLIPGSVLKAIIEGVTEFTDMLNGHGIRIHNSGGETADVGDVVRTIDIGFTTFARLKRDDLVINNILPGQDIVGVASYGQASYEKEYNSGIGSNGLTQARHDLLSAKYEMFPESFDPNTDAEYRYCGTLSLMDQVRLQGKRYEIGQLILSPTRTYMPVIQRVLNQFRMGITGMIHNTGGGLSKVLKFVDKVRIVKDNLLPIPPVFDLIQHQSGTDAKEMHQVFNMGQRLEIYCQPAFTESIIDCISEFNIHARKIGYVEPSPSAEVVIHRDNRQFKYTL